MGYNKTNYARIRREYQTKYLKAREEADRRMAELHQKSPELASIDRALSKTGAEIAMAALGTGAEYQSKLAAVAEKNQALQAKRRELMAQMGYPADYTLPPYECTQCNDSGFVGINMCECMRRDLILAAYESSGLGELMRTQSFETFDVLFYKNDEEHYRRAQENFEMLKSYAKNFTTKSENLILVGPTGLGKTHLSTSVARCVIDLGYDVYYTSAIDMMADFKQAHFSSGEERREAGEGVARYTDCDLLIIDDLGTETSNQFTTSCLYTVINNRINLKKPTIINTNLTASELKGRYTDRIASRIIGEFTPLVFAGTDIRLQKLKRK